MFDPQEIRSRFPFFAANPELVFLDSSSTTQKPQAVLDCLNDFYAKENANASRGAYRLSSGLSRRVEKVRELAASLIGAKPKELFFCAGATDAFNKITYSLGFSLLENGDEILYSPYDHNSFILPLFRLRDVLAGLGREIKLVPYSVRKTGGADIADLKSKVTPKTRVINITHLHNIFGADSDIHELKDLRQTGIIINVDATQSLGHLRVDVEELGADLLAFSGHKMFAAQGVGAGYVHPKLHEILKPVWTGGGEGVVLQGENLKYRPFPACFEAGTMNWAGILSLKPAIELISELGVDNIHCYLTELTQHLLTGLKNLPGVTFNYGPYYWKCTDGLGILSFKLENLSSPEAGFLLGDRGILIRSGNHCSLTRDQNSDSLRVSLHVYNLKPEIDRLIEELKTLIAG